MDTIVNQWGWKVMLLVCLHHPSGRSLSFWWLCLQWALCLLKYFWHCRGCSDAHFSIVGDIPVTARCCRRRILVPWDVSHVSVHQLVVWQWSSFVQQGQLWKVVIFQCFQHCCNQNPSQLLEELGGCYKKKLLALLAHCNWCRVSRVGKGWLTTCASCTT